MNPVSILLRAGALLLAVFALSGCVTSKKYRLAKASGPPAERLQLIATAPELELTLDKVLVFKGPGSWKREARWDEYVVRLTNAGTEIFVFESAGLVDVQGQEQSPGSDPWVLEKLSRTNWERYRRTGLQVVAGAGATALYITAASAAVLGDIMAGAAAASTATVALAALPVVAAVNVATVVVINRGNRKKVESEFARRRLALPLALGPGESAEGSLFFPMTPGPRQLVVRGTAGDEASEVILPLPLLADLHLQGGR